MKQKMRLVILETPFFSIDKRVLLNNLAYARLCVADCLKRNESAFASHLLFTQTGITDDRDEAQRALGIAAGRAWLVVADAVVVYTDLGISNGMKIGIEAAEKEGFEIEYRKLPNFSTNLVREAVLDSCYHFACLTPQNNPEV